MNGRVEWCDRAFGITSDDRLSDPRLGLGCSTESGATTAFAWIEPFAGTGFVVVLNDDYAEAYEVVGRAPVRVTTDEVDVDQSAATFRIAEYERGGKLLRERTVEARVAG
jgi:hypothetical protein